MSATMLKHSAQVQIPGVRADQKDALVPRTSGIFAANPQNHDFGAHFYLLSITASFVFWAAVICSKPTFGGLLQLLPAAEATALHDATHVTHVAGAAAFAAAFVIAFLNVTVRLGSHSQESTIFGCSICLAALLFFVLQALALDPFYLGGGGRPVSLLRYAMWSHTTPSMIYMIAQLSGSEDERHLNHALAANYAMLAVGVVGNVIQHPVRHAVCAVALAFFAFLIRSLYAHLSRGVNATSSLFITHNGITLLHALAMLSVFAWTLYPATYFMSELLNLSPRLELVIWCIIDCGTKILYNAALTCCSMMAASKRFAMNASLAQLGEDETIIRKLEAVVENRKQMLATVSHEMRTPLHGILGLAECLYSQTKLTPHARETVELIKSSGQRLVALINDLLDSCSLELKPLVISPKQVSLKRHVRDALTTLMPLARRGVTLRANIDADLPPIYADPARLMQILLNLLGNALRFTKVGNITVSAFLEDEHWMRIECSDTGTGIAPDHLEVRAPPHPQPSSVPVRLYGR